MICRTWRARTTSALAPRYVAIARDKVLADLRRTPGFRSCLLLLRADDDAEILFLTLWDSMDAIRAFAGPDPTRAVVLPEAEAVLTDHDHTAQHWEIALQESID